MMFYYGRRFDEAARAGERAAAADPMASGPQFLLGRVYEAQGRLPEALDATQKAIRNANSVGLGWRLQEIRLQALLGHRAAALAAFERLLEEPSSQNIRSSPQEACLLLALGQPERALTVLTHAADQRDPGMVWIGVDPRLESAKALAWFRCAPESGRSSAAVTTSAIST